MTAVRAVLFDLDDTLYDYHEYARAGLRSAADRLHSRTGERYHQELLSIYFDQGVTDGTFDRFLARNRLPGHLAAELVEAFHSSTEPLSPYEATEPVLSELSDDVALGLLTDGRGGREKLRRLGIGDYFDTVLVTPTIGSSKRNREVFDAVVADLWVAPDEAVYVGDDPRYDVPVPNDLGMTTVRLRRGRYAGRDPDTVDGVADHDIGSLEELPGCLAL